MHGATTEERGLSTVLFALVPLVKSIVFIDITQQVEQKGNNVILLLVLPSYITLNDKKIGTLHNCPLPFLYYYK